MTDSAAHQTKGDVSAPPSDDDNPALVDARKTYVITLWSAFLFIAAVSVFILF